VVANYYGNNEVKLDDEGKELGKFAVGKRQLLLPLTGVDMFGSRTATAIL
jgi:hypothetical protein